MDRYEGKPNFIKTSQFCAHDLDNGGVYVRSKMSLPVGQYEDWREPCLEHSKHLRVHDGYYTVHEDRYNPDHSVAGFYLHALIDVPYLLVPAVYFVKWLIDKVAGHYDR